MGWLSDLIPGGTDRLRRRRGLRRAALRLPRWLVGFGGLALLALVVLLALVGVPKPVSGIGDVFANLLRNLITALVLGVLAYVWFYFWTSDRATRNLRRAAERAPEQLFPDPPQIGSNELVFGRKQLVEELMTTLRTPFRAGPQVVVGDTGSGKTTLLLALATDLADSGVLPIVITLRGAQPPLDFTELAMKRFHEQIDPYIRTEDEAQKLWRWMRRRGQIAVLADDLDRARLPTAADPYRADIRLALDAARSRDLPLVVASRPAGVPPDLEQPPIDLARQELEGETGEAVKHVLKLGGKTSRDSDAEELVTLNIEAGTLRDNPFYLGLLGELLRAGDLDAPPEGAGEHAVRLKLLDARRTGLSGEGMVDDTERARRAQALGRVEQFAAARLSPGSEQDSEQQWAEAVRDGERFGLLRLDREGYHRFPHDVLHAYFASLRLREGHSACVKALREAPDAPRVQLAVLLAACGSRDHDLCRDVCHTLLGGSSALPADQRLLRAAAAAEIARAAGFEEMDNEIAEECIQARPHASPIGKRAALDQLEQLGGKRAVEALWKYGGDDDYQVRWSAVSRLVKRCTKPGTNDATRRPSGYLAGAEAYKALDQKIEEAFECAESLLELPPEKRPGDWAPEIVQLKQIAWMLPALRTRLREGNDGIPIAESESEVAEKKLDHLLDLEEKGITSERGLEASIAQGFKVDAWLHPKKDLDPDALNMLKRAVFWYSQLNLLHAVAKRAAGNPSAHEEGLELVKEMLRRDRRARSALRRLWLHLRGAAGTPVEGRLHPFLRSAADLCEQALNSPQDSRSAALARCVWDDEGVVVSGRPVGLDSVAAQLVGEITVLLNLNETGSSDQRREFSEKSTLPYCMKESRHRREFRKGCHDHCGFRLCPFQPATDRLSAHRELSRAFCRDQRINASWWTARRWWGSRIHRHSLPEFWRWIESRARI